jgi:hypothetical protein
MVSILDFFKFAQKLLWFSKGQKVSKKNKYYAAIAFTGP